MRPPLVRCLVSRHVVRRVHATTVFLDIEDKADGFRIGNCIWECLCKRCVGWKLQNAQLAVLVRRIVCLTIRKGCLHSRHHPVNIPLMRRMVENLKCDFTAIRGCPGVLKLCIPRRDNGEEVTNRCVHDVAEAATPVLIPFLLKITWSNSNLVIIGADSTRKLDPVRLSCEVAAVTRTCGRWLWHLFLWLEVLATTLRIIRNLTIRLVANHRDRHGQE